MTTKFLGYTGTSGNADLDALWAAAAGGNANSSIPPGLSITTLAAYLLNNRVFNVKDYGAVGDGVTDDHAAIQATVNLLIGIGGLVFFPQGTYYLATPLILDTRHEGVALVGASFGAGSAPFATSCLRGDNKIITTATTGSYQPGPGSPLTSVTIEKLGFTAHGGSHDHFIVMNGMVKLQMTDVVCSGGTVLKDNIQLDNFIDVTLDNVQHQGAGNYGLFTGTGASTTLRLRGGYWKNCRQAALWGASNTQLSHVVVDGTAFESNGRDGSGIAYAGAVGAGCVFDNVDNLVVNAYFEANVRADCIIGGTLDSAGTVTRGIGCRGAWVNGYFQGASGGITATYVGLYLIAVQGITFGGFYDGHQQALVRIDYTRGPGTLDVYDAYCLGFYEASAPAAIIRDDGNRIAVGVDPNGWVVGSVRSAYAVIAATLSLTSTSSFLDTATFSGPVTSAQFNTRALFAAAPTFTAVDNLFDRSSAANGATSRTQLHQYGADGVLGPLNFSIQGFPSAASASRYLEMAVADTVGTRELRLTTSGLKVSGKFGCNGATPQSAAAVNVAAVDPATTMALVNQLRALLILIGVAV